MSDQKEQSASENSCGVSSNGKQAGKVRELGLVNAKSPITSSATPLNLTLTSPHFKRELK